MRGCVGEKGHPAKSVLCHEDKKESEDDSEPRDAMAGIAC